MTPAKGERTIPMQQAGRGRPAGNDLMCPIMILPFSHSPSVKNSSNSIECGAFYGVAGNEDGPPSVWREVQFL